MHLTETGAVAVPGRPATSPGGGESLAGNNPQELLLATAAGDRTAFGALYDSLAPHVFGLIQLLLPDPVQAHQVMLEAMVEVWRTAPGYDADRDSAAGWIYTIAHHNAVLRTQALRATAG